MQSIRGRLLRVALRLMGGPDQLVDTPLAVTRKRMKLFGKVPKSTRVEQVTANDVPCEWVIPANVQGDRCLYYIHGGGFVIGSRESHRPLVARLAQQFRARALHVDYRLAPEHPFPAASDDCASAYRWLVDQSGVNPSSLVIGGDSAGGCLALTTITSALQRDLPIPRVAFCFSPITDLALEGESVETRAPTAVLLNRRTLDWVREQYAAGIDPKSPALSPLYEDLQGLPPLFISAADNEILLDDATRLAARVRAAGVTVKLSISDGLFHGFPLVPFLPESRAVLDELGEFIDQQLSAST